MSTTNKRLDFADFTKLPLETSIRYDKVGGVIRVQTSHKGEVLIDFQYDGMLDVYSNLTTDLIRQLRELESEAHEYLFKQWLVTIK